MRTMIVLVALVGLAACDLLIGPERTAVVSFEVDGEPRSLRLGEFDNAEECQAAAQAVLEVLAPDGSGTYLCGFECHLEAHPDSICVS